MTEFFFLPDYRRVISCWLCATSRLRYPRGLCCRQFVGSFIAEAAVRCRHVVRLSRALHGYVCLVLDTIKNKQNVVVSISLSRCAGSDCSIRWVSWAAIQRSMERTYGVSPRHKNNAQTHLAFSSTQPTPFCFCFYFRLSLLAPPTRQDPSRQLTVHACFLCLDDFRRRHDGRFPTPGSQKDADAFLELVENSPFFSPKEGGNPEVDERNQGVGARKRRGGGEASVVVEKEVARAFSRTCAGGLSPVAGFYGGIVAQEVLKGWVGGWWVGGWVCGGIEGVRG